LAHANGFPPSTYTRALQPLFERFHVIAFYARPFWPDCPPAETLKDWSLFADDLLNELRSLKVSEIMAIGHSLGGVATLYAAVRAPQIFSRIVLIDPTMLPPSFLKKITFMKWFGMEAREDLVKRALRRRRQWESKEQAYQSFKEKALFKKWPDEIIRAYVDGMTKPSENGGVRLVYSPEWEARIYQTIPTDVWKQAALLRQPTLVIRGEISNTFTVESERAFKKANASASFAVVKEAGHLVPQEQPDKIGEIILDFLAS